MGARCDPGQSQIVAEIVHAPLAVPAFTAMDVGGDGELVAEFETGDFFAHSDDLSRNLMAWRITFNALWWPLSPTPQV